MLAGTFRAQAWSCGILRAAAELNQKLLRNFWDANNPRRKIPAKCRKAKHALNARKVPASMHGTAVRKATT
jgi:hypothetical protein